MIRFANKWYHLIIDLLLVLISSLGVLIPMSPLYMPLTYRDSGLFLYFGCRILSGDIPYKHIWDHKPPVIYYLNALGLALTQNSRWGVWLLELIFMFIAFMIGYNLIKRVLGVFPAIFSLILTMMSLVFIMQGGNLPTEYTILMQFFALALIFQKTNEEKISFSSLFLIGVTGGIAFFTKQTAIGIWIALGFYLLFLRIAKKQASLLIKEIFLLLSGGLFVTITIVGYFGLNGALREFLDAAFRFNFFYTTTVTSIRTRLWPVIMGIQPLTKAGLFQLALFGYGICFLLLLNKYPVVFQRRSFFIVSLISLPIELLLISLSGYSHPHYYMVLIPIFFIFSGFSIWSMVEFLKAIEIIDKHITVFKLSVILILLWGAFFFYRDQSIGYRGIRPEKQMIVDFIKSHTDPEDYVLLMGAEAGINFFSERKSPTRFVYQYPIYTPGYADEDMIIEFLTDLIDNQPKLIINTYNELTPMFTFYLTSEEVQEKVDFLEVNYHEIDNIGGWMIYQYQFNLDSP